MNYLKSAFNGLVWIGGYIVLQAVVDWNTRKGEQYAKAQEHRLNTPKCDATVRGKSYGEDWSEARCTRGVYGKSKL